MLQPSDHLHGPPLAPLQQLQVFPVLRAPELDTGLQMGCHQSRAEGQNHLPQPAGRAAFDAAQDMAGLLGCERTLLGHVHLSTNTPKSFLVGLLSNSVSLQKGWILQNQKM